MLISNNTRLGRINNLIFLLKTIDVKHPISYMEKVLKHKKSHLADQMFNYIGALSMFLTSRKITYSDLIKSLISFSPLQKGTLSHLSRHVSGLNKVLLANTFVSLLRGKEYTVPNSDRINHIYGLDSYFHREYLIDRLLAFKNGERSFDTLQLDLTTLILRKLRDPDFPDGFDITNRLVNLTPLAQKEFTLVFWMVSR